MADMTISGAGASRIAFYVPRLGFALAVIALQITVEARAASGWPACGTAGVTAWRFRSWPAAAGPEN